MKVGGENQWWKIGPRHWERAAKEWKLDRSEVFARLLAMAERLPEALAATRQELAKGGIEPGEVVDRLEAGMLRNAAVAAVLFRQG